MEKKPIAISVQIVSRIITSQIIPDKFDLFQVSSDAPLQKILPGLLKSVKGDAELKDYRVLIAHQLVDPRTRIKDVVEDEATQKQDTQLRLETTGCFILFVEEPKSSTKLELLLPNGKNVLIKGGRKYLDGKEEYLIGRRDDETKVDPDIDLTPHLGEYEKKVSREQAIIYWVDQEEKWKLGLHERSKAPSFLDQERLEKGRSYNIDDGATLNFGVNPDNPYLRLVIRVHPA